MPHPLKHQSGPISKRICLILWQIDVIPIGNYTKSLVNGSNSMINYPSYSLHMGLTLA